MDTPMHDMPPVHDHAHMDGMGMCCRRGRWSVARCLVKTFVALAVLAIVFALGIGAGVHGSMRGRTRMMGTGVMNVMPMGNAMRGGMMGNMMFRRDGMEFDRNMASGTIRVLGSITKIEGNKITMMDNGAREQVVMSQADTMVLTPTGETSITMLKVGQNVVVMGVKAQDGTITAKMIQGL